MMRRQLFFSILLFLSSTWLSSAQVEPYNFEEPKQQLRFNSILEELRCLVCQNQSLADSGAGLADDLRREAYRMISEGESDESIKEFMVQRYGDFVLYDPPLRPATIFLWFGPAILVFIALLTIILVAVRRKTPDSEELAMKQFKE
mgnify:CR=1 FL=1|tara:strand:- start:109 stop:546 length:438 start_codon:yes stop_codon:yes gene_type:complete